MPKQMINYVLFLNTNDEFVSFSTNTLNYLDGGCDLPENNKNPVGFTHQKQTKRHKIKTM